MAELGLEESANDRLAAVIDALTDRLEARQEAAERTIASLRASLTAARRKGGSAAQEETIELLRKRLTRTEHAMHELRAFNADTVSISATRILGSALRGWMAHLDHGGLTRCFSLWARTAVVLSRPAVGSPRSPRDVSVAATLAERENAALRTRLEDNEAELAFERASRSNAANELTALSRELAILQARQLRVAGGEPSVADSTESAKQQAPEQAPSASASRAPSTAASPHRRSNLASPQRTARCTTLPEQSSAPSAAAEAIYPDVKSHLAASPHRLPPPPAFSQGPTKPVPNPAAADAVAAAEAANASAKLCYESVRLELLRYANPTMHSLPTRLLPYSQAQVEAWASTAPQPLQLPRKTWLAKRVASESALTQRIQQPWSGGVHASGRLGIPEPGRISSPAMQNASAMLLARASMAR